MEAKKNIVGFHVDRLLKANSMNLSELASKVHMNPSSLCRCLSDKGNPNLDTITKIATALGVPPRALFDNRDFEGKIEILVKDEVKTYWFKNYGEFNDAVDNIDAQFSFPDIFIRKGNS